MIYSSGRIQTFKGLSVLKSKIEKQENDKLRQAQKKEAELDQKNQKRSFETGSLFGFSFNNNAADLDFMKSTPSEDQHISTIGGLLIKYNYNSNYTISLQINYQITTYSFNNKLYYGDMINPKYGFPVVLDMPPSSQFFTLYNKYSNYYISMPVAIEYGFYAKPKFNLKVGAYSSYLIKSIEEWEFYTSSGEDIQTDLMKRYDYGAVIGIGLSYPFYNQFNLLFDATRYYGLQMFSEFISNSKSQIVTARIGLTYNFK